MSFLDFAEHQAVAVAGSETTPRSAGRRTSGFTLQRRSWMLLARELALCESSTRITLAQSSSHPLGLVLLIRHGLEEDCWFDKQGSCHPYSEEEILAAECVFVWRGCASIERHCNTSGSPKCHQYIVYASWSHHVMKLVTLCAARCSTTSRGRSTPRAATCCATLPR